jgi:hypothetical protein
MVDVLLTMNEAFCIAGGGVSCFFAKNKADRGLVRKNMTDSFETRGDFAPENTETIADLDIHVIPDFSSD